MSLGLFSVAFKAAVLTFGTGLAVVPLLEADVVRGLGWLTHEQFVDALTIGQITP
jgi:chromate transporter